jgi:hypothetical protein
MATKFINDWWLSTQIATESTEIEQNYYALTLNSELDLALTDFGCDLQGTGIAILPPFDGWDAAPTSTEFQEVWDNLLFMPGVGYLASTQDANAGAIGNVSTSPDGITWTARTTPTANFWRKPIHIPSKGLVIVPTDADIGGVGDNFVTSADNGVTWVLGTTGVSPSLGKVPNITDIIWVEDFGLYIVTGDLQHILWSTDLITWTEGTMAQPAFNGHPSVITYAPALGLAVCLDSFGVAYTSADGKVWTHTTLGTSFEIFYNDIAWSEPLGLFVASIEHHEGVNELFVTSTDGVSWTQTPIGIPIVQHNDGQDTFLPGGQVEWDDFTNKFYALTKGDDNGSSSGQSLITPSMNLLTSVDGFTWVIDTTVPGTHDFSYPVFGTAHFVAFAIKDATNMVMINRHSAIHRIP